MTMPSRFSRTVAALTDPRFRTPWAPASADGTTPGSLVSYTEFSFDHARDLPKIVSAARTLRRQLQTLPGARGVLLYIHPFSRRLGSLSLWVDEDALTSFVALPFHLEIMRTYRTRGTLRSATFPVTRFSPRAALRQAREQLPDAAPPGTRQLLALSRITLGLSCWIAPRSAARLLLGLRIEKHTALWARLFGVRDLVMGRALLGPASDGHRRTVQAGMVCDAADAAAAVAAWRAGELSGRQAVLLTALPAAALALGSAARADGNG